MQTGTSSPASAHVANQHTRSEAQADLEEGQHLEPYTTTDESSDDDDEQMNEGDD